jgi:hypothetical protein
MKIVINKCFGGFGLSEEAVKRYAELKGIQLHMYYDATSLKVYGPERLRESTMRHWATRPLEADEHGVVEKFPDDAYWSEYSLDRTDPALVQTVEALGSPAASGAHAKLAVVEIPDGVEWELDEYDGVEHVAEKHRTWS